MLNKRIILAAGGAVVLAVLAVVSVLAWSAHRRDLEERRLLLLGYVELEESVLRATIAQRAAIGERPRDASIQEVIERVATTATRVPIGRDGIWWISTAIAAAPASLSSKDEVAFVEVSWLYGQNLTPDQLLPCFRARQAGNQAIPADLRDRVEKAIAAAPAASQARQQEAWAVLAGLKAARQDAP